MNMYYYSKSLWWFIVKVDNKPWLSLLPYYFWSCLCSQILPPLLSLTRKFDRALITRILVVKPDIYCIPFPDIIVQTCNIFSFATSRYSLSYSYLLTHKKLKAQFSGVPFTYFVSYHLTIDFSLTKCVLPWVSMAKCITVMLGSVLCLCI